MKSLLILLLLFFTFQVSFGQGRPKAQKIDEFSQLTCCDFTGRLDYLLNEVYLEKNSPFGYVFIYSNNQDIKYALNYESKVLGHLERRLGNIEFQKTIENPDLKQNKIFIVKRKTEGEFKIELWAGQLSAEESFSVPDKLDLSKITFLKAMLFHTTAYEADCELFTRNKQFSEILSANPNLRGHIVIRQNSTKNFLKFKKEFLSEINGKFNIQENQLRTFFIKIPKDSFAYNELWLVPKKKSH